jgi:peptidoglycan/LPS O-acetylase OafA/YrhL
MNGYERISRYKAHLMGMAVMVVVYGHLLYYHSGLKNYEDLNFTIWYTLGSVEMFMFLSGFGIYQSLRKNRDSFTFYKKRIRRLMPAYVPVMVCFCILRLLTRDMHLGQAVGNLTAVGYWLQVGNQFNWYVPAILVLYLLSPLFFDCIERLGKRSLWVLGVLAAVIVAGWNSGLLMALTRFPTYFLGMYFGAQYARGKAPSRRQTWAWALAGLAAMAAVPYFFLYRRFWLWHYGMYWIPFFFSTPACMFGVTWLLERGERYQIGRGINRIWSFLGERSFEIYLCHLCFFELCLQLGARGWKTWILLAFAGICIGILYHQVLDFVTKKWKLRRVKPASAL